MHLKLLTRLPLIPGRDCCDIELVSIIKYFVIILIVMQPRLGLEWSGSSAIKSCCVYSLPRRLYVDRNMVSAVGF